jgi:hypothetical protein
LGRRNRTEGNEMTQDIDVAELVTKLLAEGEGCKCYANSASECGCTYAIWGDNYRKEAAAMLESLQSELAEANRKLAEWQDGTLRHQDHQAEIRLQMDAAKAARGALRALEIDLADANRKLAEVEEATIERCAMVCDTQALEPECPERATYCAAAIRQLKEKQ